MIEIALLGFGTVGSGTAEVIAQNHAQIEKYVGQPVSIKYILDLREFPDSPFGHLVIHDFDVIVNDPDVRIVVEMIGGAGLAYKFTKESLLAGKSVVTSNKELVAKHGPELLDIAAEHGVRYLFEASVGGGIPIIRPLTNDLAANGIVSIDGILNGTTNYILTRMKDEGAQLEDVLRDAQAKGYAEANPAADVEGADAARKIVILAALAFGKSINPDSIHTEGIMGITTEDVEAAESLGYAVKLIGHTELIDGKILAMVSPRFVPLDNPLSSVNDVFNGILVEGNMLGRAMFYGRGAGKLPTASAVVSDVIDIAASLSSPLRTLHWDIASPDDVADIADLVSGFCFIFEDSEDVLPKLEAVFGKLNHFARQSGRIAFTTPKMTEREAAEKISAVDARLISNYRLL